MWDIEIGANDPRVPENLKFDKSRRTSWLTPLSQSITRAEQLTSVQRLKRHQAHPLQTSSRSCPSADMEHEAYFYDHNVLFVLFNQPINVAAIRCVYLYYCTFYSLYNFLGHVLLLEDLFL